MSRDLSALWIALADLLFAVLAVVLVAVNPTAHSEGAPLSAQKIVTAEWAVAQYDADVDLWVVTPSRKPVFFGNRQVNCLGLDQDNKGWTDSKIQLPDGTWAVVERAKEMVSLRCLEPGHYDVGVNLYSYRTHTNPPEDSDHLAVPVHVEIVDLNPTTKVLFQRDVVFKMDAETINVASFDLDAKGHVTFTDTPLAPVTSARGN